MKKFTVTMDEEMAKLFCRAWVSFWTLPTEIPAQKRLLKMQDRLKKELGLEKQNDER